MTDWDYDELVDRLKKLEAETGIILSGSPTQKVSGDILEELTYNDVSSFLSNLLLS